jgi:tetratricopeptide (TPR) repeat protein
MSNLLVKKLSHIPDSFSRYLKKASRFSARNGGKLFVGIIVFITLAIFLVPSFSFALGNIFFGGVKPLYNVKLAHFLYKQSAYPFFSKLPPRYAHHQLSRTYFIQGSMYDALDEAQTELKIYPDDTATYYILGLTYGYMNRTYEAIDAFSRYIETHPGTWAGRNDKAWLQFRIGDIDGALKTIEPIVQNFRYTVWVQNTYCALLMNKERYAEAKTACGYAKEAVDKMTEKDWGHAYPGNDPRIYGTGLQAMKTSIEKNIELIENKTR